MNRIPMFGLGTWDLRGAQCVEIVSEALRQGYTLIDTARMYDNEKEVGEGIRESGVSRDKVFVTSKVCQPDTAYEKVKKAVDESLLAMGLNYIDLYLIHEPYESSGEMYRALEEAAEEGKVKYIGVSNFNRRFLENFLPSCRILPAVNQVEAHVYFQREDLRRYLEDKGIFMQAWSPLAAGKHSIFQDPVMESIAGECGKTTAQIALRYLIQNGIGVVPKTAKRERLAQNKDIFDFELNEKQMTRIRALDEDTSLFGWYEK